MFPVRQMLVLLILVVAMLLAMAGQAQAQSEVCKYYATVGSEQWFLLFKTGNPFLSGKVDYFVYPPDFGCISRGGKISARGAGWVYAGSSSEALAICKKESERCQWRHSGFGGPLSIYLHLQAGVGRQ